MSLEHFKQNIANWETCLNSTSKNDVVEIESQLGKGFVEGIYINSDLHVLIYDFELNYDIDFNYLPFNSDEYVNICFW